MSALPIVYSFRRCPYAIRARMALHAAGIDHELREVLLKDKPASMLEASSKGTVPVVVVGDTVIDESIDVMRWALSQSDAMGLGTDSLSHQLVVDNDIEFKPVLDRYKYFERYPEQPRSEYLEQAMQFLSALEPQFTEQESDFLLGDRASAADIAIFPFIRQFAFADEKQFRQLPFPRLQHWLREWLHADLFNQVMQKFEPWQEGTVGEMISPKPVIDHLLAEHQWLIRFANGEQAVMKYRYEPENAVDFYTTVVPPSQRGGGVAARLVDAGLAWAAREQLYIRTSCWYAEKRLKSASA